MRIYKVNIQNLLQRRGREAVSGDAAKNTSHGSHLKNENGRRATQPMRVLLSSGTCIEVQ